LFPLAPHFVIFSTRVPGFWWENMPHWLFAVCVLLTQVLALFFSVYGVFGEGEDVAPCGWPWGIAVLGISLVYFMILDVVKVYCFRYWSFELTAKIVPTKGRKHKLECKNADREYKERMQDAWGKIQHAVDAHNVVAAFKSLDSYRNTASGAA
jgi:H+-transporting ATPase